MPRLSTMSDSAISAVFHLQKYKSSHLYWIYGDIRSYLLNGKLSCVKLEIALSVHKHIAPTCRTQPGTGDKITTWSWSYIVCQFKQNYGLNTCRSVDASDSSTYVAIGARHHRLNRNWTNLSLCNNEFTHMAAHLSSCCWTLCRVDFGIKPRECPQRYTQSSSELEKAASTTTEYH